MGMRKDVCVDCRQEKVFVETIDRYIDGTFLCCECVNGYARIGKNPELLQCLKQILFEQGIWVIFGDGKIPPDRIASKHLNIQARKIDVQVRKGNKLEWEDSDDD